MGESQPHPDRSFENLSDAQLIRRMENAPDFGYDDEEVELSRRLKLGGLAWKWSSDLFNPKVEVYKPEVEVSDESGIVTSAWVDDDDWPGGRPE